MILSCHGISLAYGTEVILENVSFHIEEHEKAAIIGINGAGKSTLLDIISGQLAPDAGEVKDLVPFTEMLSLPMAIIDKRRHDDNENAKAYGIVGDIKGKTAILIDDEIATGGTICESSAILKEHGAANIIVMCSHPVFSGNAIEKLEKAPIDKIIVTDSLPLRTSSPKITQLSIAPVLAQAILAHFPTEAE